MAADERTGVADAVVEELRRRGHEPVLHGALEPGERDDWAWASEAAARDVADGRADQGIVCCWTGTGASIAANKVPGVRAALCGDAETARGARRWNDANVLALSLRTTSEALLAEILDGWFEGRPERGRATTWRTCATSTRSASGHGLRESGQRLGLRVADARDEQEPARSAPSRPAPISVALIRSAPPSAP